MPAATSSLRRLHAPLLRVGAKELDAVQAHHARHVLRLPVGSAVEMFDDAGNTAIGTLAFPNEKQATVAIDQIIPPRPPAVAWTIASAVPKAERADWLVEKLSELGATRWIPLATERSVVLPTGAGKRQRWLRIATESAKQSRRNGVLAIDELTPLPAAIASALARGSAWVMSTSPAARPIGTLLIGPPPPSLTLFIGPEGGWAESELRQFAEAGIIGVGMGSTILRVETAAIAAGAIIAAIWA